MAGINTKLDANQVLKQAYDEPNQRLRVDAQVSATISDVQIKDADGDELNINPDGSLNVALVGGSLAVEISAADGDNIAISDGTNIAVVNPDGSLNATVSATDLDIRDLSHVQDSIKIGDGSQTITGSLFSEINKYSFDVNSLNRLITVAYDDIEITNYTVDGDIAEITLRSSATNVATIAITYNVDGDFQRAQIVYV